MWGLRKEFYMEINYKKAFQQAEKELEKEAITKIKECVKDTLESIEERKYKIAELNRELKALNADLADLKEGRLNKVKERQEKDKVARKVSKVNLPMLEKEVPTLKPLISFHNWSGNYDANRAWMKDAVSGTYTVPLITTTGSTHLSNGLMAHKGVAEPKIIYI